MLCSRVIWTDGSHLCCTASTTATTEIQFYVFHANRRNGLFSKLPCPRARLFGAVRVSNATRVGNVSGRDVVSGWKKEKEKTIHIARPKRNRDQKVKPCFVGEGTDICFGIVLLMKNIITLAVRHCGSFVTFDLLSKHLFEFRIRTNVRL